MEPKKDSRTGDLQPVMTVKEAAEYLRLSKRMVYQCAKDGRLPAFKVGTRPLFYRKDLENLPLAQ